METITQSDAAGRLTLVHHKKLPGTTLLKLEYAYTDNSLVDTITESDAAGPVADVTFGYDNRGRLISEQRVDYVEPGRSYHMEYEYDQGGNRTKKTDWIDQFSRTEVEYEYDVHPPDPNPYTTWSNRLMKYETYLVTPAQQEMGVPGEGFETLGEGFETLGGGFFPPGGELRVLQSTTYYYYIRTKGNVDRVVTELPGSDDYAAVRLSYANNGRAVSFALGETWKWDGEPEHAPTDYHVTWAREFRYDGARQRYLNRQLDATALEGGSRVALSDVWSDYDGNAIYGDFEIDGGGPVDVRSFEPGLGTVDWLGRQPDTSTAKYYHTNMIGTTRFMSDAGGGKIEPAVYTAFGERIDGTNRRYGYAGAWGYQAHDEMPFLHVGHRYYDPATGRFLQRDPIGIAGGPNVYEYAFSTPSVFLDPNGTTPAAVAAGTVAGAASGAAGASAVPLVGIAAVGGALVGTVIVSVTPVEDIIGEVIVKITNADRIRRSERMRKQINRTPDFIKKQKERLRRTKDPKQRERIEKWIAAAACGIRGLHDKIDKLWE